MSGLNYDDFDTHLYCTEDRGATWNSISANLPNEPANVIVEDPFFKDLLYVGTFRGVYLSTDRGKSWSALGENLPACSVADLAIHEREKDLLIATHGRGIYKMNLAPLYEMYDDETGFRASGYLFPIPTAKRPYRSDVRPGLNFRSFEKTTITFWQQKAGNVTVSVFPVIEESDEKENLDTAEKTGPADKPIVSFTHAGKQGLNQFRWDLVVKQNKSSAPYFINYKEFLDTGVYRIRVETADKVALEREFLVEDDTAEK
jgi:hypothetical protein